MAPGKGLIGENPTCLGGDDFQPMPVELWFGHFSSSSNKITKLWSLGYSRFENNFA
jgi:hypothetical protein